MTDPNHITRSELAALIGTRASYINELEKNGRALRTPDGLRWLKAESLAAYQAGKDPSRQGVADRHAAARAERAALADPDANAAAAPPAPDAPPPDFDPGQATTGEYNFQDAKAKREYWAAEREHAAYQKEAGELMEKSAVVAAFAQAGTTLRARLESWQSTLAPQLAGRDEGQISTTLADEVERMLADLVESFSRMASQSD